VRDRDTRGSGLATIDVMPNVREAIQTIGAPTAATRWLVALTVLLTGLLAGATLDRGLVGYPAWRQVGVMAWAEYSRHADLGNGMFFYPVLAIGGVLTAIGAAISARLDRATTHTARVRIYLAAAIALAGLLVTFEAGPYMLRLRHVADPSSVRAAFAGFYAWSAVRGALQVAAFPLSVWALVGVLRRSLRVRDMVGGGAAGSAPRVDQATGDVADRSAEGRSTSERGR
jgi:hypothetical protein